MPILMEEEFHLIKHPTTPLQKSTMSFTPIFKGGTNLTYR